jgi:hypothetical protein
MYRLKMADRPSSRMKQRRAATPKGMNSYGDRFCDGLALKVVQNIMPVTTYGKTPHVLSPNSVDLAAINDTLILDINTRPDIHSSIINFPQQRHLRGDHVVDLR